MAEALRPRSFKLSEETIENLRDIARARGNTLSGALRQLILHAYEHQVLGIPRCASGNPCLVPATWEQHMALRKLAEDRAEADATPLNAERLALCNALDDTTTHPHISSDQTKPDPQPIVGQTDLEPDALPRKGFRNFIKSF